MGVLMVEIVEISELGEPERRRAVILHGGAEGLREERVAGSYEREDVEPRVAPEVAAHQVWILEVPEEERPHALVIELHIVVAGEADIAVGEGGDNPFYVLVFPEALLLRLARGDAGNHD